MTAPMRVAPGRAPAGVALAAAVHGAPTTRRVSAGIRPAAGATSRLPSWWSAEDWLESEVPAALDEFPDLLTAHHVSRDAVEAVARGMAAYADFRTGRGCRPGNERLVALLRCSLSTVQRARRVLKAAGLVVELVAGRSIMTRAERLEAWRRGSAHRQIAAEFALCSRPRRAPKVGTTRVVRGARFRGADLQSVEGDTPPGAPKESSSLQSRNSHLRRRTENEDGAPRRPPTTRTGAAGSRRLAEGTQARLGWLQGVSWRRLAPLLARFATAGWTPRDVDLAARDAMAARGWKLPRTWKASPAAYLAALLRGLDPADRPSVLEDAYEAAMRAEAAATRARSRAWVQAMRSSCPHGVPAGDVVNPATGAVACRDCRSGRGTIPR